MKKKTIISVLLLASILIINQFTGCSSKTNLSNLTSHELFDLGKEKYDNKKYLSALEHFQTIVYNYPGESIVDTAQYYLALTYFGNEEYELAQVEFNRLVINYPSSVYFEHGIFMKAVSFFEGTPKNYGLDQTDLEVSIKQFEDFLIDYPESELVDDAKAYLLTAQTRMAEKFYSNGVTYSRIRAYKAAEMYFQIVIDEYTDTEFAADATFGLAEMIYKQKKYDNAKQKFSDFILVFPKHEKVEDANKLMVEAAFKSGEAAFTDGDMTKANEKFAAFINEFPKDKKTEKANEYIEKIKTIAPTAHKDENAGS